MVWKEIEKGYLDCLTEALTMDSAKSRGPQHGAALCLAMAAPALRDGLANIAEMLNCPEARQLDLPCINKARTTVRDLLKKVPKA